MRRHVTDLESHQRSVERQKKRILALESHAGPNHSGRENRRIETRIISPEAYQDFVETLKATIENRIEGLAPEQQAEVRFSRFSSDSEP